MDIPFCNVIEPDWEIVASLIRKSTSSGHMSNFGPLYREFSSALHDYLSIPKNKEVVITSSGHTALMAAYACLSSSILIPNYTFESTRCAGTLQHIPTFVSDVEEHSGAIDLATVDSSLFDTVVVVTPLSSIPDLDKYTAYCKDNNKHLVIDGAASFGTSGVYRYGDAYCLSFHATKSFPVGECGAVVCDPTLAKRIRRYITFGLDENKVASSVGINGKVSEYTCAVGLSLLEKIGPHLERRARNADILMPKTGDSYRTLKSFLGDLTIYQSFPIYTCKADEISIALKQEGVGVLKYYNPVYNDDRFPVTRKLFEENVCLPVHSGITESEALKIRHIITDIVN